MTSRTTPGRARQALLGAVCSLLVVTPLGAGDVVDQVVVWVYVSAPPPSCSSSVNFLSQGSSAFPGLLGIAVTDHSYLPGWSVLSGQIDWWDTNGIHSLHMDKDGIDVLKAGANLVHTTATKSGSVELSTSSEIGCGYLAHYGPGTTDPFTDSIAIILSDGTTFTISGCLAIGIPDLRIQSFSISDDTLNPGQWFTLWATVKNEGDGTCDNTTLRYYRSTDDVISPASDTQIATDWVDPVHSQGVSNESVNLQAPGTDGPYWFYACVDTVTGEGLGGFHWSNCSQVIRVRVGPPCSSVTLSNQDLTLVRSYTACGTLTAGPALNVLEQTGLYAGESVELVGDLAVYDDLTASSCGHDLCQTSPSPLPEACTPCVEMICQVQPNCCTVAWDTACVPLVETLCRLACP